MHNQTTHRTPGEPIFRSENIEGKRIKLKRKWILETCAKVFNQEVDFIRSRMRHRPIADARHAYCAMSFAYSGCSLKKIGDYISRDHSTVIHGRDKIAALIDACPKIAAKIKTLDTLCKSRRLLLERQRAQDIQRQATKKVWG